MAKGKAQTSEYADRQAPDPTWRGTYHDRGGDVELTADASGHVAIADDAADRAAESMGLPVVGVTTDEDAKPRKAPTPKRAAAKVEAVTPAPATDVPATDVPANPDSSPED